MSLELISEGLEKTITPMARRRSAFRWFKALVEDGGEPSLTRSAFAYSLMLQTAVIFWHCAAPGVIDQHVVAIFNNTLIFIASIWGVRGIASDIIDKIKGAEK
ncbi:MAG: hypothetical protein FWG12_07580 [Holophagaceae bacterium]|nr:hypothetical protein [Holophagaceae bacterium]